MDPEPHRAALTALLADLAAARSLDARALDRIVKRHPKPGVGMFSKSEILAGARAFADPELQDALADRLRLRPVRTLSGVTPVAVLTRPHPCPGTCIFCPSDVRMPTITTELAAGVYFVIVDGVSGDSGVGRYRLISRGAGMLNARR